MEPMDTDPTLPATAPPPQDEGPLTSSAFVATDRADRYAKQLAAHLARRLETAWDETTGAGVVRVDAGRCDLSRAPDGLRLDASVDEALSPTEQAALVGRIEDVVGRHLVRFGTRDELVVEWHRSDDTPGGVFRLDQEPDTDHQR